MNNQLLHPIPAPLVAAARATEWQRIRVLLVDDHDAVRGGVPLLIDEQPDMVVVEMAGSAKDGDQRVGCARDAIAARSRRSGDLWDARVRLRPGSDRRAA